MAGLAIAEDAVAKSVVRSTVRGIVSAKYVEEAEYVAPGTPLYRVVDLSTVVIEAKLPETQVSMIQKGAVVSVEFGALGEIREGRVDVVLPTADSVSKNFTVRIEVENKDHRILSGMSASVKIAARSYEDSVVVTQDRVVESKEGKSVFVVKNGVAEQRAVKLGGIEGDRVVILEGVSLGETLITMGQRDVSHGDPVTIVR